MMIAASPISTIEQLLAAGEMGRCELVRGELNMMSPAGWHHGRIASRIDGRLRVWLDNHRLGELFAAETGFIVSRNPDSVRAPDVAYVRNERLLNVPSRGFFPGAPDLAVEVLSPDDAAGDVLAKVQDWLSAGCLQVWIVDPKHQSVTLYRREHPVQTFSNEQELTGGELLPGFRLRVADLFA